MYLKYQKKLVEINPEQANIYIKMMDSNRKIPLGLERLDSRKCELIKDLPSDWENYEIIRQTQQIAIPDWQEKRRLDIEKWEKEQIILRKQAPDEKAEREWGCMGKTFYLLRGIKEPNPERIELIKKRILDFFRLEENQNKTWAGREIYEDLLPPRVVKIKQRREWQKVGEILKEII